MIPGYVTGQVRDRPQIGDYAWRARTYPHAVRAIERAEARHGEPVPTCLHCGGQVIYSRDAKPGGECSLCGRSPRDDPTAPYTEEHGTEAGAKRHWRRGEDACTACLAGAARAVADRVAARNARRGVA